jgi:hypothetical protein
LIRQRHETVGVLLGKQLEASPNHRNAIRLDGSIKNKVRRAVIARTHTELMASKSPQLCHCACVTTISGSLAVNLQSWRHRLQIGEPRPTKL